MTSFSHQEFTDSIITRKTFVYNMDIYDTNMDPIRN